MESRELHRKGKVGNGPRIEAVRPIVAPIAVIIAAEQTMMESGFESANPGGNSSPLHE